jgi:outer membrane lipoprotein-sorting protein
MTAVTLGASLLLGTGALTAYAATDSNDLTRPASESTPLVQVQDASNSELQVPALTANAVDVLADYDVSPLGETTNRATMQVDWNLAPGTGRFSAEVLPMEADEVMELRITWSPANACIDFGFERPDGQVMGSSNNCTGSATLPYTVTIRGGHRLYIGNRDSRTVTVTGFVNY